MALRDDIDNKIESIVAYILGKPEEEITWQDYEILKSERSDYRFQDEQKTSTQRFDQLLSMASNSFRPSDDVMAK